MERKNDYHDQDNQAEEEVLMPIDQAFAELRQLNNQQNDQGLQVLATQFLDTPIAAILVDVAADERLSLGDIRERIHTRLYHARNRIEIKKGKAWRREVVIYGYDSDMYDLVDYQEYSEDKKNGPLILAAAAPIVSTVQQLVPELQVTDKNPLIVHLTPTVRNPRQLVLHEKREQRFHNPPGTSSEVQTVIEEQYTVYEQGQDGAWQQRSVLAFQEDRTYIDDLDTLRKQLLQPLHEEFDALHAEEDEIAGLTPRAIEINARMHEICSIILILKPEPLQRETWIPDAPYSATIFNPDTQVSSQAYQTGIIREVFALLPPAFNPIPPMGITEND